jgi:glycerol-3-phosphate dehydrogenase
VTTEDVETGARRQVRGRALINAAGPWAGRFLESAARLRPQQRLRLVKGSHIVIARLYEGEHAYILQNRDRRIVFAIPYEQRFTLIGTTDLPFDGDPADVRISPAEVDYLCDIIGRSFTRPITPSDVVWTYSGVRPLSDDEEADPSAVTRDYVLELDGTGTEAPLLSIIGGKITTYRRLAEAAMEKLRPWFPGLKPGWTARAPLPGGDMPDADFDRFLADTTRRFPWLPPALARRYARAYGTRLERILGRARNIDSIGGDLGDGVHESEVEYLMDEEWARTAEDILWRRSKLGLHASAETQARLADWMAERLAPRARTATR